MSHIIDPTCRFSNVSIRLSWNFRKQHMLTQRFQRNLVESTIPRSSMYGYIYLHLPHKWRRFVHFSDLQSVCAALGPRSTPRTSKFNRALRRKGTRQSWVHSESGKPATNPQNHHEWVVQQIPNFQIVGVWKNGKPHIQEMPNIGESQ